MHGDERPSPSRMNFSNMYFLLSPVLNVCIFYLPLSVGNVYCIATIKTTFPVTGKPLRGRGTALRAVEEGLLKWFVYSLTTRYIGRGGRGFSRNHFYFSHRDVGEGFSKFVYSLPTALSNEVEEGLIETDSIPRPPLLSAEMPLNSRVCAIECAFSFQKPPFLHFLPPFAQKV